MEKFKSKKNSKKTALGGDQDQIDLAPELEMERPPLKEEQEETHHITVGGFSPFTKGHHEVVKSMQKAGGKSHVYTTQATSRPISAEKKVGYIKKVVGDDTNVHHTKNPFTALSHLHSSGARGHVVFHGGSDRAGIVDNLKKHNNKEGAHGFYNFKSISFKQTGGERSADSKGLAGISGTKARSAKSPQELKKYLPKALHPHAAEIHKDINEETIFEAVLSIASRRKRSIEFRKRQPRLQRQKILALRRMANDLKLKRRSQEVARNLVRARVAGKRGQNYRKLTVNDKIAIDKMLQGREKLIKAVAKRVYQRVRKREVARVTRVRSGLPAQRNKRILSMSYTPGFSFELFESIHDKVIKNKTRIDEKEIKLLQSKAEKYNIAFEKIKEVYYEGVKSWNSNTANTPKQSAFNSVNSFLAHLEVNEDAAAHLRAATVANSKGQYQKAAIHRKIASALQRGDNTTAKGYTAQLKNVTEEISDINESFIVDRAAGMGVTYTAKDLGMHTQGAFAHHPSVIEMMKERELSKTIRQIGEGKWEIYSKDGSEYLGTFDSLEAAQNFERDVQFLKMRANNDK